ncbi:MAG: hypothetical protein A2912_02025 [Candidatus Buchananbacteria bacterium RIFCSPLOWO2_01_FULL_40_23b]|uniref:Uncharacterized protein n=1 Tax=Candidatus Buchananbacteria bacterium RIFCSPLOWO2_01_FULL_40_23b TaxID=1797544 RepID=A0A1G1YM54_9BACT|nr:MAG: hypothetical protein A2912_02025 [Candidatus Buchananbacteria bacterium RIFCSPLOWO2_01_FULL_40_23b]
MPFAVALAIADDDKRGEGVADGGVFVIAVADHDGAKVVIVFWVEISAGEMKVFEDVVWSIGIFVEDVGFVCFDCFDDFAADVDVEVFDVGALFVLAAEVFAADAGVEDVCEGEEIFCGVFNRCVGGDDEFTV